MNKRQFLQGIAAGAIITSTPTLAEEHTFTKEEYITNMIKFLQVGQSITVKKISATEYSISGDIGKWPLR